MINKEYFGEDKRVEFKRELPARSEKFLKDVIAFSNSSGGKIIIGIEDGTNAICGIGEQNPFRLADGITNMIDDGCSPQIEATVSFQTIEEKTIVIVDVLPGKYRPYYLKSAGKETSAYVRLNGTSRPADSRRLQELELEGMRLSFDCMQCIGIDFDEEDAEKMCLSMYNTALSACSGEHEKAQIKKLSVEKLVDFGFLKRVGHELQPTNAFALFKGGILKNAKIQCALFKGTNRDIFIDKREFTGPLYEQVEDAYQFVLKHINLGAEIAGLYRRDVYELPVWAVREMIANAVAHRSYMDDSFVQVSIFDDRVEVLSPGVLYDGLDFETVKAGKSRCRNTAVCEAFHYMKIIEQWGTGIPRIISQCAEYGLAEPVFEEFGDSIKVTVFRKKLEFETPKLDFEMKKLDFEPFEIILRANKVRPKTIRNIREIYENCGCEKPFNRQLIVSLLGCSLSNAALIISAMKANDLITHIKGHARGDYVFIEPDEKR